MNLTKTEEKMLTALRGAGEKGVDRTALGQLCQKPTESATDGQNVWYMSNVVDVHIKNLRRKIVDTKESIVTIRGFGYKLATV